jgi:hypothetical protein
MSRYDEMPPEKLEELRQRIESSTRNGRSSWAVG